MPPLRREELIGALLKDISPNQDPHLYNDTRQAFEKATDDQLFTWYNQQNDPGQAREFSWTQRSHAENMSLNESTLPGISEVAKDAIMKDISSDLESLETSLTRNKTLNNDQQHEQEQDP